MRERKVEMKTEEREILEGSGQKPAWIGRGGLRRSKDPEMLAGPALAGMLLPGRAAESVAACMPVCLGV